MVAAPAASFLFLFQPSEGEREEGGIHLYFKRYFPFPLLCLPVSHGITPISEKLGKMVFIADKPYTLHKLGAQY